MNQKLNKIYTLFGALFLGALFSNYHTNPPSAATGAPGELTCTLCHEDLSNPENFSGTIEILNLPSTILPSTTYNLEAVIRVTGGNPYRAGFQAVALNSQELNAGNFSSTDPNVTTMLEWGKKYVEHNPVHNFGAEDSVAYQFDWTSPDVSDGEIITIYTAACFGNDDGANTGDLTITNSFSATISSILPPTLSISSMDVSCFGENDGSISAEVMGGSPGYNYNWSNGSMDNAISNLSAGVYTVTVTDNNSLTSTSTVTIEEPAVIELMIDNILNESDTGNNDGEISISVNGGIPPYSFLWTDGNGNIVSTDEDPTGLNGGNHFLQITDQNNCILNSTEINVGILISNENLFLEDNIHLFPNPTSDYFYLDFNLPSSLDFKIELLDTFGKVLLQKNVFNIKQRKLRVDISNFPNGLYWIKVNTKDQTWIKKLMVY